MRPTLVNIPDCLNVHFNSLYSTRVYLVGNEKDSKVILRIFVSFTFYNLLKSDIGKKFIRRPQPEPHCHAALASAPI
jgi:hypothetical protein